MKPNTKEAMAHIIQEAREKIPFNCSFEGICEGHCDECPERLLEYLDIELLHWEDRLKRGDTPNLGDVETMAKSCQEVYRILIAKKVIMITDMAT